MKRSMITGNKRTDLNIRKNVNITFSILKSRDWSAYYVLWVKFLRMALLPIDFLISFLEKMFLRKEIQHQYPIIFVVGIQRTGSTFVSQVLLDTISCIPLGNFASIFSRSRYYIHLLGKRLYNRKADQVGNYKSYYGISKGMWSVGDSYEIWDRWFGSDHYKAPEYLEDGKKRDMRDYFGYLQRAYKKPIITKNNRNSLALTLISEIFPNAFFVVVKRKPVDVIRSTIQASYDFFGDSKHLWGLRPYEGFDTSNYNDLIEAACHQYIELDRLMDQQLKALRPETFDVVQYEDFCVQPVIHQRRIYEKLRSRFELPDKEFQDEYMSFNPSQRLHDIELDKKIIAALERVKNSSN